MLAITTALWPPTSPSPEDLLHEGPEALLGAALLKQIAIRAVATGMGLIGAWMMARTRRNRGRANAVSLAALGGTQSGLAVCLEGDSPDGVALNTCLASCTEVRDPNIERQPVPLVYNFGSR